MTKEKQENNITHEERLELIIQNLLEAMNHQQAILSLLIEVLKDE